MQPSDVIMRRLKKYYNNYKKDHEQRKVEVFFYEHKGEPWFLEKYCPLTKLKVQAIFADQKNKSCQNFKIQFLNGDFKDLDLSISDQLEKEFLEQHRTTLNINGQLHLEDGFDIDQAPNFGFDPNKVTLFIKSVPKHITRESLLSMVIDLKGFTSFSLSDPLVSQDFVRYGWVAFSSELLCNENLLNIKEFLQNEFDLSVIKSKSAKRFIRVVPSLTLQEIADHLILSSELIYLLDKQNGITENPLLQNTPPDNYKFRNLNLESILLSTEPQQLTFLQRLDLNITYLRKVHCFCYFTATNYNDERKLSAKSGCVFLRNKIDLSEFPQDVAEMNKVFISKTNLKERLPNDEIQKLSEQELEVKTQVRDWNFKIKALLSKQLSELIESIKYS